MFRTAKSVEMLKPIALIAGLAILLWSLGLPSLSFVEAANVSNFSDTLSDSDPSNDANHTLAFTATDGLLAGETMEITFPAGFDLTGVTEDDVDLDINSATTSTAAAAASGVWGVTIGAQSITITSNDTTISASDAVVIRIGNHAVDSGTGANLINNPGAEGSYEILLGGTMSDSGATQVVILTAVTVSASVDTIFNFTVDGVASGGTVNGETITGTTGSTTIPFGTLSESSATTSAQQLTVSTNAANGYVVTVQTDGALRSTTGADIDNFANGSDAIVPTTWSAPTGLIADEDTWGHWGVTSDDLDIDSRVGNQFAANLFIAASTTPREIMQHDGPVNGVGVGIGTTTVAYKVAISALQEAGDDYSTVLTYIATPTF